MLLGENSGSRLFPAGGNDTGQAIRVMANLFAFVQEIGMNNFRLIRLTRVGEVFIDADLIRAFGGVRGRLLLTNRAIVHQDKIKVDFRGVLFDDFQVPAR